jgi:ribonuclease BN (tRNA processing enzyme)
MESNSDARARGEIARTMKLHILGCGDAFGSGGRHQSGYLVEASDRLFLLDCGPTALLAMKRAGFDPRRLDAIILSHLHGDHFGGVPFFFIDYLYRQPRSHPLTIAGPPRTEEKVRQLFQVMYGGDSPIKELPPTRFQTLHPDRPARVSGIDVFPFVVPHQIDAISLGLKVSYDGKALLYSGDSPWSESFIDHSRGVDLFVCECSFYTEEPGRHINYQVLRANLPRLQCRQLLLTHLGDDMLARKDELALPIASDGMVVEI